MVILKKCMVLMMLLKPFNGEEDSVKTFNEYNDALYDSAWKSQFYQV